MHIFVELSVLAVPWHTRILLDLKRHWKFHLFQFLPSLITTPAFQPSLYAYHTVIIPALSYKFVSDFVPVVDPSSSWPFFNNPFLSHASPSHLIHHASLPIYQLWSSFSCFSPPLGRCGQKKKGLNQIIFSAAQILTPRSNFPVSQQLISIWSSAELFRTACWHSPIALILAPSVLSSALTNMRFQADSVGTKAESHYLNHTIYPLVRKLFVGYWTSSKQFRTDYSNPKIPGWKKGNGPTLKIG